MYPVSAAFLTAAATSHTAVIKAELWRSGAYVCDLPIQSGSITADARRDIVRTCEVAVSPDTDQTLDALWTEVKTLGTDIKVWRGITVAGTDEWVPLGVFLITDCSKASSGGLTTVSLAGQDNGYRVRRARFCDTYAIAASTTLATALSDLIVNRWPDADCDFGSVFGSIGTVQVILDAGAESDPWAAARTLAKTYGYDLYVDTSGTFRCRSISDPGTEASALTYATGTILLSDSMRHTIEDTYSGVVASAEGSSVATAVRGVVWDEDPSSPTYVGGPFGYVPYFLSSPLLTTTGECEAAAASMLYRLKGRYQEMSWTQVPNPALEPYDVVTINGARHVIDSVRIPLTVTETMEVIGRQVAVT